MVQVSCSVGRISRLDSRLAYQSSPLNGRTTSFLCSINTVFMEIVRVSVLRLFDRSIDPKVSKKKSTKIQSPSYSQNQIQTIPSSEPIPSIRDILFWERRYAKYRIRVLENRRGWERNERDPLSPPLEGGSAAPSSSFPRQSEPKRSS